MGKTRVHVATTWTNIWTLWQSKCNDNPSSIARMVSSKAAKELYQVQWNREKCRPILFRHTHNRQQSSWEGSSWSSHRLRRRDRGWRGLRTRWGCSTAGRRAPPPAPACPAPGASAVCSSRGVLQDHTVLYNFGMLGTFKWNFRSSAGLTQENYTVTGW